MRNAIGRTSVIAALCTVPALAQIQTVPEIHSTAAGQIAAAMRIEKDVARATTPENRDLAVARVISTLEMVRSRWPKDDRSVLTAYLLECDALLAGRWTRNVFDVATRAASVAAKLHANALLRMRVAQAHEQLNETTLASAEYRAAIGSVGPPLSDREQADVLRTSAVFLSRTGDHQSAAAAMERAAALNVPWLERAHYYLAAAQSEKRVSDRGAVASAAAHARAALDLAAGADARLVSDLRREIDAAEQP